MTARLELGYLGFEVSDPAAWDRLLTQVIGLTGGGANPDGSRSYRMDEFAQRLFVREGQADDVCAVGLAAYNRAEYDGLIGRLRGAGIEVRPGTPDELAARHVDHLVRFEDPWGNPLELCLGLRTSPTPFASPVQPAGFVTGDMGMGHLIVVMPDLDAAVPFYTDVIGMSVSDTGAEEWAGITLSAVFLYANPRHHTIALAGGVPPVKRIAHFEVHVPSVDDVGLAFDRTMGAGIEITHLPGRHTEGVYSFYGRTPSGFEYEVGTEGFRVDERWRQRHLTRFTLWGHQPPAVAFAKEPA
jgi:2,3-dihydroxybiphenyl 1,2-dioxygenase